MDNAPEVALIWYENQVFSELNRLIEAQKPSKIFFLVDENTHQFCLPYLLQNLGDLPANEVLEVPVGEEAKSAEVLVQLWMALSELEADRQALLINLGGGVVSDLGGFLAGTYLRGLPFVNIPSSLLAMVDASAGGKNGINLSNLKNRVGLFLEPTAVGILPQLLSTLPQRERKSGFAEMLKHGLIADADYWQQCASFPIDEEVPGLDLIQRSIEIKSAITGADYRESGLRKVLNFGHTVGHAIESASLASTRALLHGEAIALGMMAEVYLSMRHHDLNIAQGEEVINRLREIYPEPLPDFNSGELLSIMASDKKNEAGEFRLSLLSEIGQATPNCPLRKEDLLQAIEFLQNGCREEA